MIATGSFVPSEATNFGIFSRAYGCVLVGDMRGFVVAFAAALAFTGCGPSSGDDRDDSKATLTIDPPTSELLIDNGVLPTEDFTATLTYPDGFERDVTNEVRFNVDSGYAMFTANTLTAQAAGKTQVFASWTDKLAVAQLIIKTVDYGLTPQAAISSPRLDCSQGPLVIDDRVGGAVLDGLAALGHEVIAVENDFFAGQFASPDAILYDRGAGLLRGGAGREHAQGSERRDDQEPCVTTRTHREQGTRGTGGRP